MANTLSCSSRMVRCALLINTVDCTPFDETGVLVDMHTAGHMEAFNRAFAVRTVR